MPYLLFKSEISQDLRGSGRHKKTVSVGLKINRDPRVDAAKLLISVDAIKEGSTARKGHPAQHVLATPTPDNTGPGIAGHI